MKKLFIILLSLVSFAYAQNPTGVPSQVTGRWLGAKGYVSVDSGLHFAILDTANKPATGYSTIKFIGGAPFYWNGTTGAYAAFGASGGVAGPNRSVQYNNSGTQAGETGFEYNDATNKLTADSITTKTLRAEQHFVDALGDSTSAAIARGEIKFDTLLNTLLFKSNGYWSPVNSLIPSDSKIRMYLGVVRPSIVGSVITWSFLGPGSGHDSVGVTGVSTFGSTLNIKYPHFSQIISSAITVDETLSRYGVTVGGSVGTDSSTIFIYQNTGMHGGYWIGNGTTFTGVGLSGWATSYTVGTGTMTFTPPTYGSTTISVGAENCQFNYVGSNGYRLVRKLSALGSNFIGFTMIDDGGNPVTANPSSSDIINVTSSNPKFTQTAPGTVSGSNVETIIFGPTSNVWFMVIGRL